MNETTRRGGCPFHRPADGAPPPQRRGLLLGLAAGGAGLGASLALTRPAAAETRMREPPGRSEALARQSVPFLGRHQPGIVTPPPAAAIIAAFDVLAPGRAELESLFRVLTARIAFLMNGGTPPAADRLFPPADSGMLGPEIVPDGLTVTASVGASLFDGRYGLTERRPRQLAAMRRFPNDALDRDWCHGDLLLQFCANTPEAALHALRDVLKNTPGLLRLRWKLNGFLPTAAPDGPRETARNLLGFKDGTANPDGADAAAMERIVWVQADDGEPDWAANGTYHVVRIIRNFVERWDRTPLGEQERIMGRDRAAGAPLGMRAEHDVPDHAADPEGERIALDAHIRLANPRRDGLDETAMLRRPFNYDRGVTRSGQLDVGLLFVCFQRDMQAGFLGVQNRLNGEPLEEYVKPVGGGYFFALPGLRDPGGFLGQGLFGLA